VGYLAIPLLLLIRLPLNYDVQLISALQAVTTRLSSYALDLLAVPHLRRGNVIELADRELLVAEACSGVQSAFTIAFVALMIVVSFRRSLILVPMYLLISLAWAVIANTLRVTTIAYVAARMQVDLSEGLAHDVLGYTTLLIAILLTFSTDALLAVIFHPIEVESGFPNPFLAFWGWIISSEEPVPIQPPSVVIELKGPSGVFLHFYRSQSLVLSTLALVGIMSFTLIAAQTITAPPERSMFATGKLLIDPSPGSLNEINSDIRYKFVSSIRDGKDPQMGQNADQWEVFYGNLRGRLVLSQVYTEWHELIICYVNNEWLLRSTNLIPVEHGNDRENIRLAVLANGSGANGYLLYSGINPNGDAVSPREFDFSPNATFFTRAFDRCARLMLQPQRAAIAYDQCAMVQLWVVTPIELDSETLKRLAEGLVQARDKFASTIKSPSLESK
jgi:exosortase/archaeosortase family protein